MNKAEVEVMLRYLEGATTFFWTDYGSMPVPGPPPAGTAWSDHYETITASFGHEDFITSWGDPANDPDLVGTPGDHVYGESRDYDRYGRTTENLYPGCFTSPASYCIITDWRETL